MQLATYGKIINVELVKPGIVFASIVAGQRYEAGRPIAPANEITYVIGSCVGTGLRLTCHIPCHEVFSLENCDSKLAGAISIS